MRSYIIGFFSGVFALSAVSSALADQPANQSNGNEKQRLYVNVDVGYAQNYYGSNASLQNFINTQQPNLSSHLPLALDFAFLFGLDPRLAVGAGFDSTLDYYYQNSTNSLGAVNAGDVVDAALVGTIRYSLGSFLGSGVYLRGDIGVGFVSTNSNVYSASNASPSTSGLFLLGGAGYAIPLSPHVSVHLEADYLRNLISGGAIAAFRPLGGVQVLF